MLEKIIRLQNYQGRLAFGAFFINAGVFEPQFGKHFKVAPRVFRIGRY